MIDTDVESISNRFHNAEVVLDDAKKRVQELLGNGHIFQKVKCGHCDPEGLEGNLSDGYLCPWCGGKSHTMAKL